MTDARALAMVRAARSRIAADPDSARLRRTLAVGLVARGLFSRSDWSTPEHQVLRVELAHAVLGDGEPEDIGSYAMADVGLALLGVEGQPRDPQRIDRPVPVPALRDFEPLRAVGH